MISLAHRLALALLVISAAGCGRSAVSVASAEPCRGVDGVEDGRWKSCAAGAPCGDHYACSPVGSEKDLACCLFADRKCDTEADCCPGQTCPSDKKKCFDRFTECSTDADCGARGDRVCEKWTDSYGTSSRCRLRACGANGACPEGLSCFQGECVAALPCDGRCDPGKACVPTLGRCQSFACPASCAPGFLATFVDNRQIWDTCRLPDVSCVCAELPPLRSSDLGRFSALAIDAAARAIYVSHYDGEYGDLVVDRYGLDGALTRRDYVDGVPPGAPVRHGPSGPRGGIVDPGPDVGRYTDVAVGGGHVYVSYYDATNGDLKLSTRTPDGFWKQVRVDGANADLGLYTSMAVDAGGLPIISYFQRSGGAGFDPSSCPGVVPSGDPRFVTALKIARARKHNPDGADFAIVTAACLARTPPPASTASSLLEIPDGIGVFSAIATRGSDAYVLYMRRVDGRGALHGIRLSAGGQLGAPVVLDASGDTGHFPALAVHPTSGALAMAWHDSSSNNLKFLTASELTAGMFPSLIDSGKGPAGSGSVSWVGADVALAYSPSGSLFATYQDASRADLKLARRRGEWEILPPLRQDGAVGFFADAAFLDGTLYVSHARIRARALSGGPKVDNALLLDRFIAPPP